MNSTSNIIDPPTLTLMLKALEKSLLIFGAFVFYALNVYLKYDIMTYHHVLKKYYVYISMFAHLVFIFILDLTLLFSFEYLFNIKM
jgi:hypothetical protein